jgi:hypothetical protein
MIRKIIGVSGFILAVFGLVSAISYSSVTWFSYYVIGGTLFLAWLNQLLKNDSLFTKSIPNLLKTYGIYLLFAILIEVVGRYILHFWAYPSFNQTEIAIHVYLIGYPFVFFFIYESYILIRTKSPNMASAVILTTLINAFIHEIPNTFAWEWVYTIPYITIEIFQINIVVIVGWIILVAVPLVTKRVITSQPFTRIPARL